MKIREVITNLVMQGTETPRMINEMHKGWGCMKEFGYNIICKSGCERCYNLTAENPTDTFEVHYIKSRIKNVRSYFNEKYRGE